MRVVNSVRSSPVWVAIFLGVAGSAAGQVPDTAQRRPAPAVVIGQVVDSGGVGVDGAEVMILSPDDKPVTEATASDSRGNFKFPRVPPGGPYTFIARKLGYKPARGRGIHVPAGDTLRLRFVLNPTVVVLDPLFVKGRRKSRSSLFADEFASKVKIYRNALNLMAWYRPYMLGDPEFCSPPDSFGLPVQDRIRFRPTRNLSFYTGGSQHQVKRSWLDSLRFGNGMDDPNLPYVRQIYVNGLRVDQPNNPMRTPARMLRSIPSEHIAEMHYIDCWDKTMPLGMQYAIFITLKPMSPQLQDSVMGFVLAQAAAAGPIEGKVMSVKRPSRQVWDSILQVLTGRDPVPKDSGGDSATAGTSEAGTSP
jgi:hypothetical protein